MWIPAGENVKLTVAVKVLREGTASNQNCDLLEEARIMASVNHPCCVRIAAVCMTAQLMLVTQLMQYGCALDYIRRQQNNISSKLLLRWASQIASVSDFSHLTTKEHSERCLLAGMWTVTIL